MRLRIRPRLLAAGARGASNSKIAGIEGSTGRAIAKCLGEAQGVRCGADLGIPNRDRCAVPKARALGSTMAAESTPPSAGEA